ncbi:hypothetical protein JCM10450v2_001811 [Rhodotorula kratochvilovae]
MPVDPHESVQLTDRAYDSSDDLEAAARFPPSAADEQEEPAWSKRTRPHRDWRAAAIGLAGGILLGGLVAHAGSSWIASHNFLKGVPQLLDPTADPALLAKPVRVHYRNDDARNRREPLLPPLDCPLPVVFTRDERSADVVVLNTDSHQGLEESDVERFQRERPWQKFALWGVESAPNRRALERHFDHLRDGTAKETASFEMTYRLNSSVPATYSYGYFNYSNPPLAWHEKRSDRIAAAFITNCSPKNARTLILDELVRLLPGQVDSFGKCHQNANIRETLDELGVADQVGAKTNWNEKITIIGRYKFTVAFENSNDLDYSTEKFFQALERGTVPLVFGPPLAASHFFPAPNAAIDVAAYLPPAYAAQSNSSSRAPEELDDDARAGLARLAERLTHLASEEGRDEYEGMLAWKRDGRWRDDPDNPLGKVVRQSHNEWDMDCRLAGVFRGEEWAKNPWVPPREEATANT